MPRVLGAALAYELGMKEVIIISQCHRLKKLNALEERGEFHFKGVYAGESIKKISLVIPLGQKIILNEEYILHVQIYSISGNFLNGKIIRSKLISECFVKN